MASGYAAWFLRERNRRRRTAVVETPFETPADIAGLKLWLDAGVGCKRAWSDAPASGGVWADYSPSSGYAAYGLAHAIRIYPFQTVDGERVYSSAYLELQFFDDTSTLFYFVNWSWDAVPGAEGYRVLKSETGSGFFFDRALDVFATSFSDTGPDLFGLDVAVEPLGLTDASDGESVGVWQDQSGLGNDATAPLPDNAGLFTANVVNGLPVVRFDSDAGYLTDLSLNTPCTVFAVYALTGLGDLARRAVQGSNNWLIGPYGPPHEFFNTSEFSDGPAVVRDVFVAHAAWQDGSVSRNWVNGAFVGSATSAGGGPGVVSLGYVGSFNEPLDGDLAEVIAYDSALTPTQLANVWTYLATKYALS